MSQYVYTGNEVQLVMNNIVMDLVQNVRGTDDYGPDPVSGIGDIHVQENVVTLARHAVTISKFALRKEVAISGGIIDENGDAALAQAPFTVEIYSKLTNVLLKKYMGVTMGSADVAVTAHRVVVMDANFVATDTTGDMADQ